MVRCKSLFVVAGITINFLNMQSMYAAQQAPDYDARAVNDALRNDVIDCINHVNQALGRAFVASQNASEAIDLLRGIRAEIDGTDQAREAFIQDRRRQRIADQIEVNIETVRNIADHGIFVAPVTEYWNNVRKTLTDPEVLIKISGAIVAIFLSYYLIKYGVPALIKHFTQPKIVSETSRGSWVPWGQSAEQPISIHDLIFEPSLQAQISDLVWRIKAAEIYDENLPNLLLFGESGTGKTAFAKALAYDSGLDYALTSGAEFAKIADLSVASDELRNLFDWAHSSNKGLIVFIDEAESLFPDRKFSTTPKITQDLINTFLSLISDKSQKNIMFILATNHPFKLDDAVVNRIGMNIKFTMPTGVEIEKILTQYLLAFANEKHDSIVEIHPEVRKMLPLYAKNLGGFSPRDIKFVAENMIIRARQQRAGLLTDDIAQFSLNEAIRNLQQNVEREKERAKWLEALSTH